MRSETRKGEEANANLTNNSFALLQADVPLAAAREAD